MGFTTYKHDDYYTRVNYRIYDLSGNEITVSDYLATLSAGEYIVEFYIELNSVITFPIIRKD